jgi:DNA polymerase-1
MPDINELRGPAGQPSATGSFVGSPVAAPASPSGRTDEEPTIPLNKGGGAQFSELVRRVGEDELAAFIRDHAALLRPVTMGEEEFAVILHDYADFLRNGWPKETAIPLKAPDRTPLRSALVMSEEENAAFIRDNKIESFVPTPESEAEERWYAQLLEAIETSDWNAPHLSKEQIDYAAADAVVTWRLAQRVLPALDKQAPAYEIQMQAVPAAMRMQQRGFKFDVAAHASLIEDLTRERVQAEQAYIQACQEHGGIGCAIPDTPERKRALLQTILTSGELDRWQRTEKAGVLSTKRSDLRRAAHYPPIVELVRISTIDKLLSSFGVGFAELVNPVTGRIHANYHVASTASGRASCSAPNLQQIPRDPRFRKLFVPEPGDALVVADYSSMELRAAAHIAGDPTMTRAFKKDLDLHRITAARMSNRGLEEVTSEERRAAKAVNFGAIYGIGANALVQSAWDSYSLVLDAIEARMWLDAFITSYPTFARWRRQHHERCEAEHRIVIGKDAAYGTGRVFLKSHLRGDESFYTRSCNLPVQGLCADISMQALAYVDDRLFEAGVEGGPVAWLHDEIVLEVREDQAAQSAEILKRSMVDAFAEALPGAPLNGLVKPDIGANWGDAKPGAAQTHVAKERSARPQPDYARIYRERRELLVPDAGGGEAHCRAYDYTVRFCCDHTGVDLEAAKQVVLAAISEREEPAR